MSVSREESSRINGAQSSGPISDEGKARSSQNALKQGLFSKRRFIGDENPDEFDALVDSMAATHQPATPTEWLLIDRMAMARWRLGRLERAEAGRCCGIDWSAQFANDDLINRYGSVGLFGVVGLGMRLNPISPHARRSDIPVFARIACTGIKKADWLPTLNH